MIRNLLLAAALCFGSATPSHGWPAEKQQVARQNYLSALNAKHEGVRNSAIFRVLQYKAAYPQDDCRVFIKRLQRISLNDSSVKNRMYAFLACAFLQDGKLPAEAQPPQTEDEKDGYFAELQELLQRRVSVAVQDE